MFKIGIGHIKFSTDRDDIAHQLYQQALSQLDHHSPVAALFFSTYGSDVSNFVSQLYSLLPNGCSLIGASSYGEVSSDLGYAHGSHLLILFASDLIQIDTGIVLNLDDDRQPINKKIVSALSKQNYNAQNTKLALIFPDGLKLDGTVITQAFSDALGDKCALFGGAAAESFNFVDTWQLYQNHLYENSVPFILFSGPVNYSYGIANCFDGGWDAIGEKLPIDSQGLTVTKIGDRPALDFFNSRIKLKDGLLSMAHPLAIYNDEHTTTPIFRDIISFDEKEKTLQLMQTLPNESCWVQMTQPVTDHILQASRKAYLNAVSYYQSNLPPDILLWFSCVTRNLLLEGLVESEFKHVQHYNQNIPTAGFYVYGEIGPGDKNSKIQQVVYHSSALIVLAIGELKTTPQMLSSFNDEYSTSLLLNEVKRLEKENHRLRSQLEKQADHKNSLGQLHADRTHLNRALIKKGIILTAVVQLLEKNGGRLPPHVIKGSGKINKHALAKLVQEYILAKHLALDININAVYRML